MINKLLFLLLTIITLNSFAQEFDWAKRAGGNNADNAFDNCMDLDGNILVTGYFKNTITFGDGANQVQLESAGGADMYIAKYDIDGTLIWALKAGGATGFDWSNSIAVDGENNMLVTGYFDTQITFGEGANTVTIDAYGDDRDIFVAKYNSNGELIWAFGEGGSEDDSGQSITTDDENNIFIGGKFKGTATFNHGGTPIVFSAYGGSSDQDAFIAKYNSDGNLQWATQAGGSNGYDGFSNLAVHSQIGLIANGYTYASSTINYYEPYIVKFDPNGNMLWQDIPSGVSNDNFSGLALDDDGNIYVSGFFTDALHIGMETLQLGNLDNLTNAFMAKYSPIGNVEWAYAFPGTGGPTPYGGNLGDEGRSISISPDGYLFICGYICGQTTFGNECHQVTLNATGEYKNIFLAKFNTDADLQWALETGGNQAQSANSMAINENNDLFISGAYDVMAQIGDIYLSGFDSGYGDIFLCKNFNAQTFADFTHQIDLADVGNNNDASDLQVTFEKPLDETTVDEYRIFVVNAENAAAFSLEIANSNTHFTSVYPENLNEYQISLQAVVKDVDGDDIQQNIAYRVYVLSVADGDLANENAISCPSIEIELVMNVGLRKLNDNSASPIHLFPNPTKDWLSFKLNKSDEYSIYNMHGQLVLQSKVAAGNQIINLESLSSGMYFFKLKNSNLTTKINIQ